MFQGLSQKTFRERIGKTAKIWIVIGQYRRVFLSIVIGSWSTKYTTNGYCVVQSKVLYHSWNKGIRISNYALGTFFWRALEVIFNPFSIGSSAVVKARESLSLFCSANLKQHNLHCWFSVCCHYYRIQSLGFVKFLLPFPSAPPLFPSKAFLKFWISLSSLKNLCQTNDICYFLVDSLYSNQERSREKIRSTMNLLKKDEIWKVLPTIESWAIIAFRLC